jgi:tryptophan halogenase
MELYKGYGRVFRTEDELFSPLSWTAVFEGQGHNAETFDPLALGIPIDIIEGQLRQVRAMIAAGVQAMPPHSDFVRQCVAPRPAAGAPRRQFGAIPAAPLPWESN